MGGDQEPFSQRRGPSGFANGGAGRAGGEWRKTRENWRSGAEGTVGDPSKKTARTADRDRPGGIRSGWEVEKKIRTPRGREPSQGREPETRF
jgi:hypothetical protein